MSMLVDCSKCHAPLQLPLVPAKSIRCAICRSVTLIADPRSNSSSNRNRSTSPSAPPKPKPNPSPYNHAPASPPPHSYGRKRAVVCGVSYTNTDNELKGCLKDAKCMRYMLIHNFKFPQSSILMLTEEETDPYKRPTKNNIRMAMYWLVQGCKPGDSLVFHFSGHGSQQRNYSDDEVDGRDETLCPTDFKTHGMIVDGEINETIVRPLPRGVKLHAIIDACHSGTVLDLPFLSRMNKTGKYVWEDHRPRSGTWKGTNGGEAISFSGCDDNQTSEDTQALSRITSTGAMTFSFIQAIERGHGATYGKLLNAMRSTLRNAEKRPDRGIMTTLLAMLFKGESPRGFSQEPQLTTNEPFDVYSKPFSM